MTKRPHGASSATPTPDPAAPPAAELAGVTHRYGDVTALDDLDLAVRPGEVLALLGPNGAGKTTAVSLLLGLLAPDRGRAELFGHNPRSPRARVRAGTMLQISNVPETLRVGEHVHLFSSYYPSPLPVAETLELAGLSELADRPFGELSGGQRQRLLFALAVCGDPDLLFLDEPTVGLDVATRRTLWERIRELVQRGRTVLLTTHYLEEAETLADRIVVLNRGRAIAEGTPSEIERRAGSRRVRCRTSVPLAAVRGMPGVVSAERRGEETRVVTARAEPLVRELLRRDPELSRLEVRGAGLEEAFLALTTDGTEDRPADDPSPRTVTDDEEAA